MMVSVSAGMCVCVVTYLLNVSVVGPIDELLQLSQAVGLSQSKDQLCFDVGLPGLLAGHLQKLDQVLPVSCPQVSHPFKNTPNSFSYSKAA